MVMGVHSNAPVVALPLSHQQLRRQISAFIFTNTLFFFHRPDLTCLIQPWGRKPKQTVSQTGSQSVGQRVCDLILCPSDGTSLSSPLRETQMAWGISDQSEDLSVCQTDSSSVPEDDYQATATATAAATTVTPPPDGCVQLITQTSTTSCLW